MWVDNSIKNCLESCTLQIELGHLFYETFLIFNFN